LQKYPNPQVCQIGSKMFEVLLKHEFTRSNDYLIGTLSIKKFPSQQVAKQVQRTSPRSVASIPRQETHVDKYLNEPVKRIEI
jgi:hypothetical protein